MARRLIDENEQNKMILDHIKLINYLVRKYKKLFYELDREDIESASYYALFKATINYKPEKGRKFSTYVYKCVQNQVYQLANKRGINEISLDYRLSDSLTVADVIVVEDSIKQTENRIYLEYLLSLVTEKERNYLIEHYMNQETQANLAKRDNYCYQNVARIIEQAKKRIRQKALH